MDTKSWLPVKTGRNLEVPVGETCRVCLQSVALIMLKCFTLLIAVGLRFPGPAVGQCTSLRFLGYCGGHRGAKVLGLLSRPHFVCYAQLSTLVRQVQREESGHPLRRLCEFSSF